MKTTGRFPLTSLYQGNALISEYLTAKDSVKSLQSFPPDLKGIADAIQHFHFPEENRIRLHRVLMQQYEVLDPERKKEGLIDLLLQPNTFTITAAHQPNLMGGPLYTIYKICGVIHLSKQLKQIFPNHHFVPVFWCGSEDHDAEELNHFFTQGKKYSWDAFPAQQSFGRNSSSALGPLLEELSAQFPGNHTRTLFQILKQSVKKGERMALMFSRIIHHLFENENLLILDQDQDELKTSMADWFRKEIAEQKASKLLEPTLSYLKTHYHVQANPRTTNLFVQTPMGRNRLEWSSTGYRAVDTPYTYTAESLLERISQQPGFFSPNVILRPLYQCSVLPDLIFTGGAGEIGYWLELKTLFDHSGRFFPVLMLRNSVILLSRAGVHRLNHSAISPEELLQHAEVLLAKKVKAESALYQQFEQLRRETETAFHPIVELLNGHPGLQPSAALMERKHLELLETLGKKILRSEKRKQEELSKRLVDLNQEVFPSGVFQERRENFLSYYHALGPVWIERLIEELNPLQQDGIVFDLTY